MVNMVIVLLVTAVVLDSTYSADLKRKINNCSCQRNGNHYVQLAEHKCEKFTQYDNVTRLTHTHSCSEGSRFSVETCVCEHSQEVTCEGCGPLVCEVEGNVLFESIVGSRRAGDCEGANKRAQELFASCIIKDAVASTLLSLRYKAADRGGPCTSNLAEGCERLDFCYYLMLAPENTNIIYSGEETPKFLCENYKEAERCLRCVANDGCKVAEDFRKSLREAATELCPHIQEFTCPADF